MKVLFVQEAPFLPSAIQLMLAAKGIDTVFSEDQTNPHAVIEEVKPNALIADVTQQGGIDYVTEAKKKNLPVIAICKNGSEDLLQKAFDMGADDYVSVPVSFVELALRITILLKAKLKKTAA